MSVTRAEEIRKMNRLSTAKLVEQARGRLLILDNIGELYLHFARSIADTLSANNSSGDRTVLILPYGPVGQYPQLLDIINRERISLRQAVLFFMDEYADDSGNALPFSHPLSFRGQIAWLWDAIAPELRPLASNVIFPSENNEQRLEQMIEDAGGAQVCYGGIGVHGHLAFNEPEPGVRDSGPRLVRLNEFTRTINSIRSEVGGDLENFPRHAWTLGMKQCLSAARVELYCRNDIESLDWANTVLRLAVLGEPGDDYPVTWIREHGNYQVITDRGTATPPRKLL